MDTRPLVYYSHWCPDDGPALLAATARVERNLSDVTPSADELVERARDATALCYFVPDALDAALIARLPKLRILAGFGKGYDNVDVAAATARGIWVTNVPDALTEATADLAWTLMTALARNVVAADAAVRDSAVAGWTPRTFLGTRVFGARLGLIGFGAIGRALAQRATGFAMTVRYVDIERAPADVEARLQATAASLDEVLRDSDFVIIVAPLSDATRGMIGAREIALMHSGAYLINAARGSLVDEAAVAAALEARRLAGYAADVFAFEDRQYVDRPPAIDPGLLAARRTVFTPHLGTATLADRRALAISQAGSVLDALRGIRPRGAVNDIRG